MSSNLVFVDRRKGQDRRYGRDPFQQNHPSDDPTCNMRQNFMERRDTSRTIADDYYAYMRKALGKVDYTEPEKEEK